MASLKQIRRRISGIRSTRKITRAMKMVATAKMRRAQDNMEKARPYSYKLREAVIMLADQTDRDQHPLLSIREPERIGIICITSDRGMAGAFNANICRRTQTALNDFSDIDVQLITIGRKGNDFFKKRGVNILKYFPSIFQEMDFEQAVLVGRMVTDLYIDGKFDRFYIVFNEFKNVIQQNIVVEQLLPIVPESGTPVVNNVEFIFEPEPQKVLDSLLPLYINNELWHVILESYAAEQAARMAAMDKATENADELIETLTLQYNKARQDAITKELLDIVGGAEGLQ